MDLRKSLPSITLAATIAVLSGCVSLDVSDRRAAEMPRFQATELVTIESTGPVNMNVPLIVRHQDLLLSS